MNRRFIKFVGLAILAGVNFTNCSTERETTENETMAIEAAAKVALLQTSESKTKIKKETALLIGRVLQDKAVRDYVVNEMKATSEDGEIISISYLAGNEKSLRKNEVKKYNEKKASSKIASENIFVKALETQLAKNPKDFKTINDLYEAKKAVSVSARVPAENPGDVLSDGQQLYLPYNESYGYSSLPRYYTSDERLDGSPTNSGYYFNGVTETYVSSMTNDFIDENPTFVVSEIDPCDQAGGVCTSVELNAATSTIDPINNTPQLLTFNANHAQINDDDYLLSTKIPRIRVKGTNYMGFGGTHQKLVFMRGSYDTQNVSVGSNGAINASGYKEVIGEFRTKRKNVRKEYWLDFNKIYDTDWRMSENEQALAVFSSHHISVSGSIGVTAKVGLKLDSGKIKPTVEATFPISLNLSFGSTKYRANSSQSRKYVLANNVGPGITGKTYNYNGIDWNVKDLGIIEFFYNHYTQNLN